MATLKPSPGSAGLATVEAALLLPILLFLVFAIIEFSWLFLQYGQVSQVARDAARALAMGQTGTQVTALVATEMTNVGLPQSKSLYVYTPPSNLSLHSAGDTFTVEISVPYVSLTQTGFLVNSSGASLLPGNLDIKVTMVYEFAAP